MKNRIRIISTSDIHGYVFPYSYVDGSAKNHGLARISTMVKKLRDENTLLIDNGDILEGSPLTFYHYLRHPEKKCPLTDCLKAMHYDYINIGNHDFNYGSETLLKHCEDTGAVLLTNNVFKDGKPIGCEYDIRYLAGKKVAIFGITTHFVPKWEKPEHIVGLEFEDAFEACKRTVEKIRKNEAPDYIICVYHGGFENDPDTGVSLEAASGENEAYRMVQEIEGIDVIVAGHQHRIYCGKIRNTAYTEPFFEGTHLSVIDIDTETGEIKPQLLETNGESDKAIEAIAYEEEQECQKWLDTPLGYTDMDLRVKDEFDARFHKSQLATFINNVQKEITGSDLSSSAIFLRATGFYHEITMRDLISTYIFPNTLVVKRMNGKVLRQYLEFNMHFWSMKDGKIIINPLYDFPNPQHHNYDMIDGIEYVADISRPEGERIISLTRNGKPVEDDDEFTISLNNYRASGGGNFDMVLNSETVKEYQSSLVDLLANYILEKKNISFPEVHNIEIR